MNQKLLQKHINHFKAAKKKNPNKYREDYNERLEQVAYYQSFTKDIILPYLPP